MTFTLDEVEMGMVESYKQEDAPNFNGTLLRMAVTDELIIVSNSDG